MPSDEKFLIANPKELCIFWSIKHTVAWMAGYCDLSHRCRPWGHQPPQTFYGFLLWSGNTGCSSSSRPWTVLNMGHLSDRIGFLERHMITIAQIQAKVLVISPTPNHKETKNLICEVLLSLNQRTNGIKYRNITSEYRLSASHQHTK